MNFDINIDQDEDYSVIEIIMNDEVIGHANLEIHYHDYEYFEGDLTEAEYDKTFPDGKFIAIDRIDIERKWRGNKLASILLKESIELSKKYGINCLYLNACPILPSTLYLDELVNFYKRYGFEVLLDQENNVQMLLKNF